MQAGGGSGDPWLHKSPPHKRYRMERRKSGTNLRTHDGIGAHLARRRRDKEVSHKSGDS
jgi:hypothetical protein